MENHVSELGEVKGPPSKGPQEKVSPLLHGLPASSGANVRKQVVLICGCFFFVGMMVSYYSSSVSKSFRFPQHSYQDLFPKKNKVPGFLVYTPGCKMPDLKPLDPMVKKFVYKPKPVFCGNKTALTALTDGRLYFNESAISDYGVSDRKSLSCCYQELVRANQDPNKYGGGADKNYRIKKECVSFKGTVAVNVEFLTVTCRQGNRTIYRNCHFRVPVKTDLEERCRNNRQLFQLDSGISTEENTAENTLSVLLLGIDAVSRLNFFRTMPTTKDYLLNNLSAVEMAGYNKVGDNTFPNLVAILMGHTEQEMAKICWPKPSTKMDDCPWIWKNYTSAGYRTIFAEDSPWMGVFTYLKTGFVTQPMDYYMRPYMLASESLIGHEKPLNANLCQGSKLTLEVTIEYVKEIASVFASKLYFSLIWTTSLTHDYLNLPMLGDSIWLKLLVDLNEGGFLNNTVLILLSDHGIRWGGIRETYQGKMEERLPFLFFVFPEWFRSKYKTAMYNMQINSHRLSTPFDMHETLKDFFNLEKIRKEELKSRTLELTQSPLPRGISLFLPLPDTRTCNQSGIAGHWCTCQLSYPVSLNDTKVIKSSQTLLNSVNTMLHPYRQCAQLNISDIRSARVQVPKKDISGNEKKHISDYTVVIETSPSKALFEGTVRYTPVKDKYDLTGTISRINRYGDQSSCVAEYHMKKYCYCGN